MVGKYYLEIKSRKVVYKIHIERSITVIKGYSGTGKTSLIRLVESIYNGKPGIKCNIKDSITVLKSSDDYEYLINKWRNKIVFIDEDCNYLTSTDFAEIAQSSDNYFVIISRHTLDNFCYSYKSIYELETIKKDKIFETSLVYKFKDNVSSEYKKYTPDEILCEDSKSNYQLLKLIINNNILSTTYGKDRIADYIDNKSKSYYIIADGAAFGNTIENISLMMNNGYSIILLLEESFEYIILTYNSYINKYFEYIENPYKYADTKKYKSYERYYTDLINKICLIEHKTGYRKSKLIKELQYSKLLEHIKSKLKLLDNNVFI